MDTIKSAKETKAIKEHKCSFCYYPIRIGETYLKSTHVNDGSVYDLKSHIHCENIAHRLNMYEDARYDEGLDSEYFQDAIHNTHDGLILDLFPREERDKYKDVIAQIRYVRFNEKLGYVLRFYNKLDGKNYYTNPPTVK